MTIRTLPTFFEKDQVQNKKVVGKNMIIRGDYQPFSIF